MREGEIPGQNKWFVDVENAWLEVVLDDQWMAAYRFANQGGGPVIAEVRVFPWDETLKQRQSGEWGGEWLGVNAVVPKGGVTSRLLRRLKVGSHMKHFQETAEWMATRGGGPQHLIGPALTRVGWRRLDRHARPASSDDTAYFAAVAQEYEGNCQRRKPPIKSMAVRRKAPPHKIRAEVYRARELGLVTRDGQGTTGGKLTEKGRRAYEAWVAEQKRKRTRKRRR